MPRLPDELNIRFLLTSVPRICPRAFSEPKNEFAYTAARTVSHFVRVPRTYATHAWSV